MLLLLLLDRVALSNHLCCCCCCCTPQATLQAAAAADELVNIQVMMINILRILHILQAQICAWQCLVKSVKWHQIRECSIFTYSAAILAGSSSSSSGSLVGAVSPIAVLTAVPRRLLLHLVGPVQYTWGAAAVPLLLLLLGGRLTTRRTSWKGLQFDHGCQFIRPVSEKFKELCQEWHAAGAITPWDGNIVRLEAKSGNVSPRQQQQQQQQLGEQGALPHTAADNG